MFFEFFLIFFLGTAVGSFINVLIDRNNSGENFIIGKSHCDKCKENIPWYDLIPVFSFMLLKAKCRHCKTSLSFYYLVTEITTGILFAFTFFFYSTHSASLISIGYYLVILSFLLAIFFADLKYGIIPDKIVYPAITIVAIFSFLASIQRSGQFSIFNYFLSALGAFIFFLILFIITRGRGMGMGDIKFAVLMGLFLGFPQIIVGLYLAFLTGAIVGVILILWRKKKLRGTTIPFGPFLVLGTIISLFYSDFFLKVLMLKLF